MSGIDVRKFIVASTEDDAMISLSVWRKHPEMRASLERDDIYDDVEAARDACADLIRRAEEESPFGCKVPCDEHSRCVGFNPQVWRVQLTVERTEDGE